MRYVDTAPFYGVGAAEHRVGDALRERDRDELGAVHQGRAPVTAEDRLRAVAGRPPVADAVRRDLRLLVRRHHAVGARTATSASAWRVSTSCTCTISAPTSTARNSIAQYLKALRESGYKALEELRRTGVVSAIGIGVNEKEVLIEALGVRRLGRLSARRPLHAAGTGTARRPAAAVPGARHLDRRRRPAELRHPGRS